MTDQDVRDFLERMAAEEPVQFLDAQPLTRRARRRAARTVIVGAVGIAAAVAVLFAGVAEIRTAPAPVPAVSPTPAPAVMRENDEVLRFTGRIEPGACTTAPGDLVAVDPRTRGERVLAEDLDSVYSARWSADGRWLAYEADTADGDVGLWVMSASEGPRVVATGANPVCNADPWAELDWKWSPTGAELAIIEESETLRTVDVATGETSDLGPVAGPAVWAWSPDGSRFVFTHRGSPDGVNDRLYSVDAQSGERSLLARLPDEVAPTAIREILWSPDGAHVAVGTNGGDFVGSLFVMDADGSNIRLVTDESNSYGFAWSPDGTRLAFGSDWTRDSSEVRIRVATMDGAAPAQIGTVRRNNCYRTSWGGNFECSVTWSPDGTQVAFRKGETGNVTVFDAAGAGEAASIDELTYLSWDGGRYLG